MQQLNLKSSHAAVKNYYAALHQLSQLHIDHEMAVRSAFQDLLSTCGRRLKLTLVPEFEIKRKHSSIRVDGALLDTFHLAHGYWEAKDEKDDLDREIKVQIRERLPARQHHLPGSRARLVGLKFALECRLDFLWAKELYGYPACFECLLPSPPLCVGCLEDGRLILVGVGNRDKFLVSRIEFRKVWVLRKLGEVAPAFPLGKRDHLHQLTAPTIVVDPPNEGVAHSRLANQRTIAPILGQNAVALVNDNSAEMLDVQQCPRAISRTRKRAPTAPVCHNQNVCVNDLTLTAAPPHFRSASRRATASMRAASSPISSPKKSAGQF
jgi:hypothetical protein